MKMYAWVPRQGWFEVADVLDYFNEPDQWGSYPKATVLLKRGDEFTGSLECNFFYNLQG